MATILVLHGPNLNLLGSRESLHYGFQTLSEIDAKLQALASELGHTLSTLQSNHEGILIDRLQLCLTDNTDFILLNPAAYTHTSIALRDALLAIGKPFVEVHISNIHKRESFRAHSYFSDIAEGTITGLGAEGYLLALRYAHSYLLSNNHDIIGANAPLWT
ncbi:MAG: type II 3-dehydroquinate dehydratase [Gammaproteobacteria bacterium]|nr:type II 3-dehydroquinate dehydratase [Gammaproteobacteria bacterium]